MQRDEDPNQELLMLGFQRQRKAIDDAVDGENVVSVASIFSSILFISEIQAKVNASLIG